MAGLAFQMTVTTRRTLCLYLVLFNVLLLILGFVLIVAERYLHAQLTILDDLITERHGKLYMLMLKIAGLLTVIAHACGIKVMLTISDWKKLVVRSQRWQSLMLAYLLTSVVLTVLFLVISITSYFEEPAILQAFTGALDEAIQRYGDDVKLKEAIDRVQMSHDCCGVWSYEDWYDVAWADAAYVKYNMKEYRPVVSETGKSYTSDSVPFSCCSVKSDPPCVHHDVSLEKRQTIYKRSCAKAASEFLRTAIANYMANFAMGLFFLQLILTVLYRYVQTSTDLAISYGDPTLEAPGYLLSMFEELTPPERSEALQRRDEYLQALARGEVQPEPAAKRSSIDDIDNEDENENENVSHNVRKSKYAQKSQKVKKNYGALMAHPPFHPTVNYAPLMTDYGYAVNELLRKDGESKRQQYNSDKKLRRRNPSPAEPRTAPSNFQLERDLNESGSSRKLYPQDDEPKRRKRGNDHHKKVRNRSSSPAVFRTGHNSLQLEQEIEETRSSRKQYPQSYESERRTHSGDRFTKVGTRTPSPTVPRIQHNNLRLEQKIRNTSSSARKGYRKSAKKRKN